MERKEGWKWLEWVESVKSLEGKKKVLDGSPLSGYGGYKRTRDEGRNYSKQRLGSVVG